MGFSSVTGEETIMSADNVSFDGTSRGGAITTDGQLLIGSTASPHIKVGTLTSTGSTVTITYSSPNINLEVAGGGSGISTIDGDSGSVTGSTIDLYANSGSASCGSSVSFTAASATEMDLVVTDTNFNTLVGQNTGSVTAVNGSANTGFGYAVLSGLNGSLTQGNQNTGFGYASCNACSTGNSNTGVGYYTLLSNATGIANVAVGAGSLGQATAGNYNTGIGGNSLGSLGTGSNNLAIGYSSGNRYSGSESSNIIIGHNGVPLDSNVIRIGTQGSSTGEQDECFIAGIAGSTGTSSAVVVGLDTSVGQLLQTTITAGSNITVTPGAGTITIASTGGGSGITTIDGDNGSVTGSTISLFAASGSASNGASVSFTAASATEMDLVLTSPNANIFIGESCGVPDSSIPAGSGQLGLGVYALASLTGAGHSEQIAIGYSAGYGITTGDGNIVIGYEAMTNGFSPGLTGSGNIVIGNDGGANYTGSESQNVLIKAQGTTGDSNVIRISDTTAISGAASKCFIGGIAGVTGTSSAVVAGLDTSTGQLLQTTITAGSNVTVTPGAGTITIAATGGGSGITTIDGDSGSATGSTINLLATSNAGSSVSFSASGSTVNLNVTNATNTLIGLLTGNSSLSGINNTAIGSGCLSALTSGSRNSMMGFGTGGVLTTGTSNVGIGDSTFASAIGASNCTGVGAGTLSSVTSGNYNTAVGYGSSHTITTGTNNTSIGGQSSCSSTGTQNISIGYFAGNNYNSAESSNIAIGNIGVLNESNVIRIGTSGSGTGQQNACYIAGIDGVSITGSAVLCSSSGQLGDVVSALRFKEDIQDLSQTDDLLKLRPVSFKYKTEKEKNLHYGFVAEEVEKVFPSLVLYDKEKQPYSVAYHEMAPLLLMEIQKLRKEIDDLKKRVA